MPFGGGGGYREPDFGSENVTAATVGEAVEPESGGACSMPHADGAEHRLYLIKTAENLRWLFEQATGSDLAACFALRFSAAALDITSWADTGIGSDTEPFTGHFDGGGRELRFRVDGNKTPANGGSGLFPSANGAVIRDLELTAEHVRAENSASAPLGGAFTGCTVDSVNVVHSMAALGVSVIGATDHTDRYKSAGLLLYSTGSRIENCTVVDTVNSNILEFNRYGGIVLENRGTVTNCSYAMQQPAEGGRIEANRTGGIAYVNFGRIEQSRSYFPAGIAAGRFFGGIAAGTGYGAGAIVNCVSDFRVTVANDARQAYCVGGIAGELMEGGSIADCRVTGGVVLGWNMTGGIAGQAGSGYGQTVSITGCDVSLTSIGTEAEQSYIHAGGIVGYVNVAGSAEIASCTSQASVFSCCFSGGLVGQAVYSETPGVTLTPADPLTFTMSDCHMLGDKVVAVAQRNDDGTLYSGSTRIGGAVGSVYGWREGDAVYSTLITGCTSMCKVEAGDWAGGFIGEHSAKEVANKPKGRENTIEYCRAFGDAETLTGQEGNGNEEMIVGGFIGLGHNSSMNLVVNNCTASGNVTGGYSLAGGFLGGDAWRDQNTANTAPNNKYLNCTATGNVKSLHWAGGWGGWLASYGLSVENCTAAGDVEATADYAGGFVAQVAYNATLRNCAASGNVAANNAAAGFASYINNADAGDMIAFEYCTAAGNVSRLTTETSWIKGSGGFAGRVIVTGGVQFRYCTASGAVTGNSTGGFMGYSEGSGAASFYRCEAYGSVKSNANGEAGGFIGWSRTSALSMDGCASYGSTENGTTVNDADSAGFISALESKGTIKNCASYAPSVAGYPDKIASFLIMFQAGSAGTTLTNCTYTVCSAANGSALPMVIYWGADTANLVSNVNPQAVSQADRPAVPGGTFACSIAASGNTLSVSVSGVAAATDGTLTELSVSLDGGRNYTQLVYNGVALTALGSVPAGGAVANSDVSFTYTALGNFALSDVRVYFVYSDGFTRVCRAG